MSCVSYHNLENWGKNEKHSRLQVPLSLLAAAAAAKSLQSCPTLCDAIDGNPPGSAIPGILQARTLEWAAISFSIKHHSSILNYNNSVLHSQPLSWEMLSHHLPAEQCGHFDLDPLLMCKFPSCAHSWHSWWPQVLPCHQHLLSLSLFFFFFCRRVGNLHGLYMEG